MTDFFLGLRGCCFGGFYEWKKASYSDGTRKISPRRKWHRKNLHCYLLIITINHNFLDFNFQIERSNSTRIVHKVESTVPCWTGFVGIRDDHGQHTSRVV